MPTNRFFLVLSSLVQRTILIRFFFLGFEQNACSPFIVCGQQVGLIRPDVMKELLKFPEVFFIRDVPKSEVFEVCT